MTIWNAACDYDKNVMEQNVEIYLRNQARWGKKVRFIGVSVDKNQDDVKDTVDNNVWYCIDQYWAYSAYAKAGVIQTD